MITVNGVKRTLEQPLSVTEYLEKNQYVPVQVAIELNDQILARELYGSTILKEGLLCLQSVRFLKCLIFLFLH